MTNLISGKEALIALANGEEVETKKKDEITWSSIGFFAVNIFKDERWEFRLKPRTISINGIEVLCCGKDYQYGDAMYILNSLEPKECSLVFLDEADEVPAYWWKTEDEVKQVVAALRQVFGGV